MSHKVEYKNVVIWVIKLPDKLYFDVSGILFSCCYAVKETYGWLQNKSSIYKTTKELMRYKIRCFCLEDGKFTGHWFWSEFWLFSICKEVSIH